MLSIYLSVNGHWLKASREGDVESLGGKEIACILHIGVSKYRFTQQNTFPTMPIAMGFNLTACFLHNSLTLMLQRLEKIRGRPAYAYHLGSSRSFFITRNLAAWPPSTCNLPSMCLA